KEKSVSLGEEDTESKKTVAVDQEPINVDEVESPDEPQPKTIPEGIGRKLRSRTPKPSPTTVVTPAVTKKV
ncbi:hypothetical protein A2U01_0111348, partial [Trifolium medium]|nr:hypothetical protein [Trifolium medium]